MHICIYLYVCVCSTNLRRLITLKNLMVTKQNISKSVQILKIFTH